MRIADDPGVRPGLTYVEGEYETVEISLDNDVFTIALDRPDAMNAWNRQLMEELASAFVDAHKSDARVVILTGNGEAFSAGGDFSPEREEDGLHTSGRKSYDFLFNEPGDNLYHRILNLRQPLIIRMNGDAIGAGAVIGTIGDIVIADEDATIGDPHVRLGLSVPTNVMFWPLLTNLHKAKELLMTGDVISAEEAQEHGLVTYVESSDSLDEKVAEVVDKLANGPQLAIQFTKMLSNRWIQHQMNYLRGEANALEAISASHADHEEGINAFEERRSPDFPSSRSSDE